MLLATAVMFLLGRQQPKLAQFEVLKNPRITTMADQRMLVVEGRGEPGVLAGKALGLLYRTFFKIKGAQLCPPRARWPQPPTTPGGEMVGIFGMPIPATVQGMPGITHKPGLSLSLTTWNYGEVAEILHVGPYSGEGPTVAALKRFIADSGYEIAGPHEEVYLKGPGLLGPGNPKKYYTIIRYQVKKAGGVPPADAAQTAG
jgi:hypothetical protein